MDYGEVLPSPNLVGFIKRFWFLQYAHGGKTPEPETVLPDGCPEIVFNLSDRFERVHAYGREVQSAALFAGQIRHCISIRATGRVSLFGVRFQPAGAWPLGRFSMHELTDEICDIAEPLGPDGSELKLRISEAASFKERIAVFEGFFLNRLATAKSDAIAHHASSLIQTRDGHISIRDLADRMGIGERRLERRFRESVGISPKLLARIVRFQGVVRKIRQAETPQLLDAVHEFGYFDQSHMVRDFKEFSGETPLAYFQKTHKISDIFTASS